MKRSQSSTAFATGAAFGGVVIGGAVALAVAGSKLYINGKVASTDVRVINGSS